MWLRFTLQDFQIVPEGSFFKSKILQQSEYIFNRFYDFFIFLKDKSYEIPLNFIYNNYIQSVRCKFVEIGNEKPDLTL
jgi:hypothetical protein